MEGSCYENESRDGLPPLPDAIEFVRKMAAQFPLAIASGSRRAEIEHLLEKMGLRGEFPVLATADDCKCSKPSPEAFLIALAGLQQLPCFCPDFGNAPLHAAECLVVEDAPAGVEAAHAAGMRCLALASNRPLEELQYADWVYRESAEGDFEGICATLL